MPTRNFNRGHGLCKPVSVSHASVQGHRALHPPPLPLRVVASYPSWDRFVVVAHPRIGITLLAEIKKRRIPVRMPVREDPTHSTLVLLNQILAVHGFTLADIESWGGSFQLNGPPHDQRRMDAVYVDELDIICDEGIPTMWFDEALKHGMQPITLEDEIFEVMEAIRWRKVTIPAKRFPHLTQDYGSIDFSGWLIYTRAGLDDKTVYKVCAAIHAKDNARGLLYGHQPGVAGDTSYSGGRSLSSWRVAVVQRAGLGP